MGVILLFLPHGGREERGVCVGNIPLTADSDKGPMQQYGEHLVQKGWSLETGGHEQDISPMT